MAADRALSYAKPGGDQFRADLRIYAPEYPLAAVAQALCDKVLCAIHARFMVG